MVPDCFGGEIHDDENVSTLEDCLEDCKKRKDCRFVTYSQQKLVAGLLQHHQLEIPTKLISYASLQIIYSIK